VRFNLNQRFPVEYSDTLLGLWLLIIAFIAIAAATSTAEAAFATTTAIAFSLIP
jgi:hypothetical protein